MSGLSFEWDSRKAAINLKKHGVSFEEAQSAFFDERAKLIDDPGTHGLARTQFHAQVVGGLPLLSWRGRRHPHYLGAQGDRYRIQTLPLEACHAKGIRFHQRA